MWREIIPETVMNVADIIQKSRYEDKLDKEDIVKLLSVQTGTLDSMLIMGAGSEKTRRLCGNMGEVQGQFAVNLCQCPVNCEFCSFSSEYDIFKDPIELSPAQAVCEALKFEAVAENAAVYLMCTANYDFGKFIETAQEVKKNLKDDTLLIANIGDQNGNRAKKLKEAGVHGVYHAIRIGEGEATKAPISQRLQTVRNFQEAGLIVGTCVEPIGPEHTNEQIADHILLAASFDPAFSGAARRITIPGSKLEKLGMISELQMSQIVAVTRLATPSRVMGNCTHEPCVIGAAAGANLFWAETGGNPRDVKEKTEEGRGTSVSDCAALFSEADMDVHRGASRYFLKKHSVFAEV
jgi:biotin synthase